MGVIDSPKDIMNLIYDVGMFNGDDTAYYLAKGLSVVGVEANPNLIPKLKDRFQTEIGQGRLFVENVAITDLEGEVEMFIAEGDKPQSSLSRRVLDLHHVPITSIKVHGLPLSEIVSRHGPAVFMKIDIEHNDALALRDLARNGMKPPEISVEAHSVEVLVQLYNMGYTRYRFVNGKSVSTRFANIKIRRIDGTMTMHRFTMHSSGPFGEDLEEPWLNLEEARTLWSSRNTLLGPGWYDIHAR